MQVEFLGHSGFILMQGTTRVACDPWLSPLGAFHASWFQFPCNHHLGDRDYVDLAAVVITSSRADHLDPGFLKTKLRSDKPVILPRLPSRSLWQAVRQICPNPIIELKPGTDYSIGDGLRVLFILDERADDPGSAVIFRTREAVLLDIGEARFTSKQRDQLKVRTGGRIDALLVPCAGVTWDPLCYSHPKERMAALTLVKRVEKLEYAYHVLEQLTPRVALPLGGPVFLDESLSRFNEDAAGKSLVPDQQRCQDWLRQRGFQRRLEIPLPGDRLNLRSGEFDADPAIRRDFSFDRTDAYRQTYAERMRPAIGSFLASLPPPTADLFEPFRDSVRRAGDLHPDRLNDLKLEIRFIVNGPHGGEYVVRCNGGELTIDRAVDQPAPCTVRMESLWLEQILHRRLPWTGYLQSLRVTIEQDLEAKDDHLQNWLSFIDAEADSEPATTAMIGNPGHA